MTQEKSWFEKNIIQPLGKFANFKIIKSLTIGMQSIVSILIIGAMLSIVSIILGFIPSISESEFVSKFNIMKDLVFGVAGVLTAFGVASADAKQNKIDQQAAGFVAIVVYFIFMNPTFTVDEYHTTIFSTPFARFGLQGIFVAMVAGIFSGEVSAFFKKRGWIMNAEGLPDIAKVWFEYLIAGTFIVLTAWVFTNILNVDLWTLFTKLLTPLMSGVLGTFWFWLLFNMLSPLLFYFGIHPMAVLSIVLSTYYMALVNNVELLSTGLAPTVANGFAVANVGTMVMLSLGGSGNTLGLSLLMLFSKNKAVKKLGRLAVLPSILNINEPIVFGLPIVLNPVFLIPFIFGTVFNAAITYLVMNWGWVAIPSSYATVSFIPSPIMAYMQTQDVKAVVLILVLIVVDMLIWLPFLKMHEKNLAAKETN